MFGFLPHFLGGKIKRKIWRKTSEPTPLIFPVLCWIHKCRRAQIHLTFLMSRTSGVHTRAPHGSASPWGTGNPMAEALPAKPQPHHTLAQWLGQDGTQGHLRAQREEARSIWEHKPEPGSDTAQGSPGTSMTARQAQENKWAPRLRIFITSEGAQLQLNWRLKLL